MHILKIAMLCSVAAMAIAGCSSDRYDTNNDATQSSATDYSQDHSYMADTAAAQS